MSLVVLGCLCVLFLKRISSINKSNFILMLMLFLIVFLFYLCGNFAGILGKTCFMYRIRRYPYVGLDIDLIGSDKQNKEKYIENEQDKARTV